MGRGFEETAHRNYIGNKTYQDNWDYIFRRKDDKKENQEDTKEESEQKESNDKEEHNVRSC